MPKVVASTKPRVNPLDLASTRHLLSDEEFETLVRTLQPRFEATMQCHPHLQWSDVEQALRTHPDACATIAIMEATGGEPNVIEFPFALCTSQTIDAADANTTHNNTPIISFVDCSAESPAARRAICYDAAALESRKTAKPLTDAHTLCEALGARMLNRDEYEFVQSCIDIDTKTSSWIETPDDIRALGGALFGDKRYNTTFIYHNGADSYYSARGVRTRIDVC